MEQDSGYFSDHNSFYEYANMENEPVYYSDSDSDYSDTEVTEELPPQQFNVQQHEHEHQEDEEAAEEAEEAEEAEMTYHEMSRRREQEREEEKEAPKENYDEMSRRKEKEKEKEEEKENEEKSEESHRRKPEERRYEAGACGGVEDGYENRRAMNRKKVTFEIEESEPIPIPRQGWREEEIFDMEMDIDEFIASELERHNVDVGSMQYLDEHVEIERLRIEEEQEYRNESEFNANIPEKYRWSKFDECCIGIYKPELEQKMKEMRKSRVKIGLAEVLALYIEIQETKTSKMHEIEKGKLQETVEKKNKEIDKLTAKLREARQEQALARRHTRMIRAKLKSKTEEVEAEKEYSKQKDKALNTWEEGSKEMEAALAEAGVDNRELLKEINELRMIIQEMKKQERRKN